MNSSSQEIKEMIQNLINNLYDKRTLRKLGTSIEPTYVKRLPKSNRGKIYPIKK